MSRLLFYLRHAVVSMVFFQVSSSAQTHAGHHHLVTRTLLQATTATQGDPESFTLTLETGIAIALVLVLSALANSVGIGGGFFWVVIFNALLGFGLTGSAALSQALIACGTAGATAYNLSKRHPWNPQRPLVDFSLSLVLMPPLVLGITVGSLLNLLLPKLILVCILFVVLVAVGSRTMQQALKLRREERADCVGAERAPQGQRADVEEEVAVATAVPGGMQLLNRQKAQHVRWERPLVPWKPVAELIAVAGLFLGLQIGKTMYSRCDWQFIVLFCVQGVFVVAVSAGFILMRSHAMPVLRPSRDVSVRDAADHSREEQKDYPAAAANGDNTTAHGDNAAAIGDAPAGPSSDTDECRETENSSWNVWHLSLVWGVTLLVGVVSGAVGLGGGVLVAPLLVELKVHPQTAASTATLMVLCSSTIAAVSFALDDVLNLVYAAVYGPTSLVGGFIGVFAITALVHRWHVAWLVTAVMAVLVLCAAGLVVGFAGRQAVENVIDGAPIEINDICS